MLYQKNYSAFVKFLLLNKFNIFSILEINIAVGSFVWQRNQFIWDYQYLWVKDVKETF